MGNTKGRSVTSFAKTGLQHAFNALAPHTKTLANPIMKQIGSAATKGIDTIIDKGSQIAKQGINSAINFAQEKVFQNKLEPTVVEKTRNFATNLVDNGTRYIRQKKEQYHDQWSNKRPMHNDHMARNMAAELEPGGRRNLNYHGGSIQGLGDLTR